MKIDNQTLSYMIEQKRSEMIHLSQQTSLHHHSVVAVSQELDKLIAIAMYKNQTKMKGDI